MPFVGWLEDATEDSVRAALAIGAPELARLPLRINPRPASSNPLWWSSSAVVGDSFVVKFAWSEVRAVRLWREGVILDRLKAMDPSLAIPDLVALNTQPALVVTRMTAGEPLGGACTSALAGADAHQIGRQLAGFLVRLHAMKAIDVVGDLPVVEPTAQSDTQRLRSGFPRLVDQHRSALVLRWCDWVDGVLADRSTAIPEVFVHGDLHGSNQLWDRSSLAAVVDFEESGVCDPHFDFRYLPGVARSLDVLLATMHSYTQLSGRPLTIDRVMAWNVLTALGDALWRTEAGVTLPGGGNAASYVDDLGDRLHALRLD